MTLRPFFSYFGGKWRAAPKYPPPRHGLIVEPFAGSAGYALRYADRDVLLVEKSAAVASVWAYLLRVGEDEVRGLPTIAVGQHVDDFEWPCPEARDLVGFVINRGADGPRRTATAWGEERPFDGWSPEMRERVAGQLKGIRHWRVIHGDYTEAPDVEATWFIDPPYDALDKYRWGARHLDFAKLAAWCRSRRGQVMVCESTAARWLPFRPFGEFRSNQRNSGSTRFSEALWTNDWPGSSLWLPTGD